MSDAIFDPKAPKWQGDALIAVREAEFAIEIGKFGQALHKLDEAAKLIREKEWRNDNRRP